MNFKVYKWCAVPQCKNTSIKTPNKVFVHVPNKKIIRNKWLKLARRNPNDVVTNSPLYFCEDHFDLPNDMENYMEYHVMGSVSQIRMKRGCMPKKFIFQPDRKTQITDTTEERSYVAKKRRMIILEECEKQIEKSIVTEQSSSGEIASVHQIIEEVPQLTPRMLDESIQRAKPVEIFLPHYESEENEPTHEKHKKNGEKLAKDDDVFLDLSFDHQYAKTKVRICTSATVLKPFHVEYLPDYDPDAEQPTVETGHNVDLVKQEVTDENYTSTSSYSAQITDSLFNSDSSETETASSIKSENDEIDCDFEALQYGKDLKSLLPEQRSKVKKFVAKVMCQAKMNMLTSDSFEQM